MFNLLLQLKLNKNEKLAVAEKSFCLFYFQQVNIFLVLVLIINNNHALK